MSRARTPYHSILERLLECAVNLVAHILNRRVLAHDERFTEIRLFSLSESHNVRILNSPPNFTNSVWLLPLGVKPHQAQLLPNSFHHLLHSEIELARHDGRVRLAG